MVLFTITLSPATLAALNELGYALYVMRAFNTTNAASKPLVWLASARLAENVLVGFGGNYEAYVSASPLIPGGTVSVSSIALAALGQTATVDAHGVISIAQGGNPNGITLVNGSTAPYTAGLRATIDALYTPFCGAPLYGLGEDIVVPLERYLLTFSTGNIVAGTVITHAMSQSLLVDMTGADKRTVAFDINTGWDAGGAPWATTVPAGADLSPILVHEMPLLSKAGG